MKIELQPGQQLFFTSDTHYNHSNICKGTSTWVNAVDKVRAFETLEDMNNTIVNNINGDVGENDILVHFGDWSFGGFDSIIEFRKRIKCKNIYLVLGNHDEKILKNQDGVQGYFKKVFSYVLLDVRRPITMKRGGMVEKFKIVCCHFPIASFDGMNKGNIHLFGHCHLPKELKCLGNRSMDIGMDGNNMMPYSLDEIKFLKDQKVKSLLPFDHHIDEVR